MSGPIIYMTRQATQSLTMTRSPRPDTFNGWAVLAGHATMTAWQA